jgi:hypothetical protein
VAEGDSMTKEEKTGASTKKTIVLIVIVAVVGLAIGWGSSILTMRLQSELKDMMKGDTGFLLYIIIMTSLAVFLLLVMFILVEIRMNRMMARLDEISASASQFVKLGMEFTKKPH